MYILYIILQHITNCITSNFCDPIILNHILVWSNKLVIRPNIQDNVYQKEYYQDIYNPKNNKNLDDLKNWMVYKHATQNANSILEFLFHLYYYLFANVMKKLAIVNLHAQIVFECLAMLVSIHIRVCSNLCPFIQNEHSIFNFQLFFGKNVANLWS